MLGVTIILFSIFVIFQVIYIIIPLLCYRKKKDNLYRPDEQDITILIPSYNEDKTILNCLSSAADLDYSRYEVIVINDGSGDSTMDVLQEFLLLRPADRKPNGGLQHKPVENFYQSAVYPNFYVIDKVNGGKADALNSGINYASHEIIVTIDADSFIQPDALKAINSAFWDTSVIAAGGMVHIIQGVNRRGKEFLLSFKIPGLIRFQVVQYLVNFYLYKTTQARLGSITIIAGAFGAFRKDILLELGGYRNTTGEDMDITVRIQYLIKTRLRDKRLIFIPEAVCFTECPESYADLFKQRFRWQKGFIDCFITYFTLLFRKLGLSASLYLLIDSFILGTLTAFPTIIIPAVILVTGSGYMLAIILFTISSLLGVCQNLLAFYISYRLGYRYTGGDYVRILAFILKEVLTYRLLGLIFNTIGTLLYFFNRQGWYRAQRKGTKFKVIGG